MRALKSQEKHTNYTSLGTSCKMELRNSHILTLSKLSKCPQSSALGLDLPQKPTLILSMLFATSILPS